MILRLTAVLALALSLTAFAGYLQMLGEAPWSTPEMRHLRAMKDRTAAPDSLTPVSLATFQALPHDWPLPRYAPLEQSGVSLDGYVQHLVIAPDGDTHFEVAPAPRPPGAPDTCYVTAEVTPRWYEGSARWSFEGLVASLRPNHGGTTYWASGPRRARVSGWLLYDLQYDARPGPEALRGDTRVSGWEIHPITRLELWSDSLQRFVDLPR